MPRNPKRCLFDECGYAVARDGGVYDAHGVPAPQVTPQMTAWVLTTQADALERWGAYDKRLVGSVVGMITLLSACAVSGYTLADGTQFAYTTTRDLAILSGWNSKKVVKALHACLLAPTKGDGDRFARYCDDLRRAGKRPYVELVKAGDGAVKSSYRYVGIAALPSQTVPLTPGVGGTEPVADPVPLTCDPVPQTPGVRGSDPVPQTRATVPQTRATVPQTRATVPLSPGVRGTYSSTYLRRSTTSDGTEEVNEADSCFDGIVSLFPRGVGKPEFAAKTRAAFDALLDSGAAPGAVLARAWEVCGRGALPAYPLLLLERREVFADLFFADPQAVIDWAADYGATTDVPAAREIFDARHPGPFSGADLSNEADALIRQIYAANEAGLQRAYAAAHAGRAA